MKTEFDPLKPINESFSEYLPFFKEDLIWFKQSAKNYTFEVFLKEVKVYRTTSPQMHSIFRNNFLYKGESLKQLPATEALKRLYDFLRDGTYEK